MLLSGLWDDGTTAAQLTVNGKTNEIPVFRDLLDKIPPGDLEDAVISADQMHTQRKHARKIEAAGAFFLFTIGGNQENVRDVVFGEDGSRAAAAYQAFAAIRNAVTGAFRLLGVPGIAAQLRASRRDPYRLPFRLLGLAAASASPV